MKIIFIHGLESTPETSSSAKAIKEYFSNEYDVIIPDYKPKEKTHSQICDYFEEFTANLPEGEEYIAIGISLGGYWALNLTNITEGQINKVILLNPSLKYYSRTGEVPPIRIDNSVVGKLIVNRDDDVVDYRESRDMLRYRFSLTSLTTGGHRMNNMDTVITYIASAIRIMENWTP